MNKAKEIGERTYYLNLENSLTTDVHLILEPEGLALIIPPTVTYPLRWNQPRVSGFSFVFNQNDEYGFSYSLIKTISPSVYKDDKLIHGHEQPDLTDLTQTTEVINRVSWVNRHMKEIGFGLEIDGMDFVIESGSTFDFIWKDSGTIYIAFKEYFQNYKEGIFYSLDTGTVFANVYRNGKLIYPVWGEDGLIRDWRLLD